MLFRSKEKVDLQKNYTDVGVERTAVDDGLRAYLVSDEEFDRQLDELGWSPDAMGAWQAERGVRMPMSRHSRLPRNTLPLFLSRPRCGQFHVPRMAFLITSKLLSKAIS